MTLAEFAAMRAREAPAKPKPPTNEEWSEAAERALNANAVPPTAPIPRPKGPMLDAPPDLL